MNYKKIIGAGLAVMFSLALILPVKAFGGHSLAINRAAVGSGTAASGQTMFSHLNLNSSTPAREQARSAFCAQFNQFSQTISRRLTEGYNAIKARRAETAEKLTQNRTERRTRWENQLNTRQEKRLKNYERLAEHAQTEELKAAVEKFKQAVETAIDARQTAVDEANATFHAAVDAALTDRKELVDSAVAEYRTRVDAARAAAAEACQAEGFDAVAVRTELQNALQAAREYYKSQKDEIEKFKADLAPAREAHQAALKQAVADFKAAMTAARAELSAAFLTAKDAKVTDTATTSTGE